MASGAPSPPDRRRRGGVLDRLGLHRKALRDVGREPDYRYSLANERTFLAWIRTSLALLAGGVAVVQFVPTFSFRGGSLTLGVILVLESLLVAAGSYLRWSSNERAMRLDRPLHRSAVPAVLAIGLVAVGLLALAGVILGGG